ncbi:MAG: GNAT family N-acetyltransferase [Sphingomonadales bacterium]|nr:GNAT family N-acetyltransferase [Sphingomonadales bacterium]
MFIRSDRLFLRPGWPEDGGALYGCDADPQAVAQLVAPVQEWLAIRESRNFPRFLVTLPGADGARVLGVAGLQRGPQRAELVAWIAPEHAGQGFATEAGRAVLRLARTLGHRALDALHTAEMPAARRFVEKLGFRPTGEWRQRRGLAGGHAVSLLVNSRELIA